MSDRPHTSSWKRFFTSRLFLILALIIAILVAVSYARAYYKDYKVRQEIAALQEDVKNLEKKKIESLEILQYVKSPDFVEEKARTELNLKKPDEHVAVIPIEKKETIRAETPREDASWTHTILRNPIRWWYYFTRRAPPPNPEQ